MPNTTLTIDVESNTDVNPLPFIRDVRVLRSNGEIESISPFVLRDLPDLDVVPFRTPRPHVGQPNFSGDHYHAGLQCHVGFESLLEDQFLFSTESDATVEQIVAQPFQIEWNHPRLHRHVPDYLVRLSDGQTVLTNCKPPEKVAASQELFDLIALTMSAVGIRAEVFSGDSSSVRNTNAFLHRFRLDPQPPQHELPARLTMRWVFAQNDPTMTRAALTAIATGDLIAADGISGAIDDDSILVSSSTDGELGSEAA